MSNVIIFRNSVDPDRRIVPAQEVTAFVHDAGVIIRLTRGPGLEVKVTSTIFCREINTHNPVCKNVPNLLVIVL